MGTGNIAQLKSIFLHAQELEAHQVRAYLDEACAGEPELRARAEQLLKQTVEGETRLLEFKVPGPALSAGRTLVGRFRIVKFIGKGGMGDVYLADDLELGGKVALKTVRASLLVGGNAMGRFRREVQLSRKVTHPNICRVFDVGHEVTDGQEFLFLTMEFLEGHTLGQALKTRGKLGLDEAEALLRQIASGLDALHAHGIMHRDLKPANVMLVGSRTVIMDFGLARAFESGEVEAELTQTGAILGTPAYMAPEQQLGESATAASDIYAFGLIMYEVFLGRKPTLKDSFVPGETGLSLEWERRVLRCLARDPANRPPSATDALSGPLVAETVAVETPKPLSRRKYLAYGAVALLALAGGLSVVKMQTQTSVANVNDEISRARALLYRYFKTRNIDEAIGILGKVVNEQPNLAVGHSALANAYLVQYRSVKKAPLLLRAKEEADRAIQLDSETADPHTTLGFVYTEQGKHDLAGAELRQAMKLDPRSAETQWGLAQLYKSQGRKDDMDLAIQKAVDLAPDDWRYRQWLGAEYRERRNFDAAITQYKVAAKLIPESPVPLNSLGMVYFLQDRLPEAEKAYTDSLKIEERAVTLSNLGIIRHRQGKFEEASALHERALKLGGSGETYLWWANLAASQERVPGRKLTALVTYRKAIELAEARSLQTPNDSNILSDLASYQAAVGEKDRAILEIRKAIAISPDSPDVARRAAETYEILHLRDDALRWLTKALELGYSLKDLQTNEDLAGLRADPRYTKIESRFKEK